MSMPMMGGMPPVGGMPPMGGLPAMGGGRPPIAGGGAPKPPHKKTSPASAKNKALADKLKGVGKK
jgi:hypothetical protein